MARRRWRGPIEEPEAEHRVNRDIRFYELRVIAPDGTQLGVMSPDEARAKAQAFGMDLVEIVPKARPPVCKIMDYGKFKYERAKKAQANSQSQPTIKEIRLRPKTDDHDLEVKLGRAERFLRGGDKVRLVMRMRGRERAYPARWSARMLEHFKALEDIGKITSAPRQEGRTIAMMVEPALH